MWNIVILGLASLLTDISSEMVYPILPLYLTTKLGVAPTVVGLIEGISESLVSLLKISSGYISDKFKRRKNLTIIGYACSAVGKILIFLSRSWSHVFLGRLSDRFGKGVRTAPRDALIADTTDLKKRGRAFGLHRMLDTLGAVSGVALAYYFLKNFNDYHQIFLYSIIPALLGVFVLFWVKEKKIGQNKVQRQKIKFMQNWQILPAPLKIFLIISFVFSLGNSSNQFLLLRSQNLGFSALKVLLLYLVFNISYAVFSYPAGRVSDFLDRKIILGTGYLCYSLVYFGFAIAKRSQLLWILFIIYGFYMGLTDGVEKAYITDLAQEDMRATILGMHGMLTGIGLFPASFLAGIFWKHIGSAAPFYFGGLMAMVSALWLLFFIPKKVLI